MATVVIIGGGIGGSSLAKYLENHCNVVLIDAKEYLEIIFAELRCMVEPSFAEKSIIYHTEYLFKTRIVISTAVDITKTEVLTAQGDKIAYDYLVIATGHVYPGGITKSERISYYKTQQQKIESANSILIVGGGATGVELAGEIVTDYPGKKVTLVSRGSTLIDFLGPKASQRALDWLISKKVDVVLEQSIDLDSARDGRYITSGGKTIEADCHFMCTGMPLGSKWLKNTIVKDCIDDYGRVMVDPNLRVKGHKNIFAIGDITDIPEIKQGHVTHDHASMTAKNLKLLMAGGNESQLAIYKPGAVKGLVSLGRKEGVLHILGMTISGRIPGWIKCGDMFIGKVRKEYGLKP